MPSTKTLRATVMKPVGEFRVPGFRFLRDYLWSGVGNRLSRWFTIEPTELAGILENIRAQLPTTEILLLGKPQTGKSSIIRALTGVSADIIGQGFRPHTAHTQRYHYPSIDVPLLIFTDTVGLGETTVKTTALTQELETELARPAATGDAPAARILLLTIKTNDFATDFLRQIVTELRRQHPQVPCLLAITCLHEAYPPGIENHPEYPPTYDPVQRTAKEITTQFASLVDRTVLIDFTLEEDEYTPVFYGLPALVDALSELLPEAEARLMTQLLKEGEAVNRIGELYRDAGRRYILPFALMAGTLAAIPLPFATMPVLTSLQITLITLLGRLYGQIISPAQAGGVVSAIAGGFLAQAIGQQLLKFIPGFGSVVAASWAAAYTWALGEAACVYFGDLMGGKTPDPQRIKAVMDQSFQEARSRFKDAVWSDQGHSDQDNSET